MIPRFKAWIIAEKRIAQVDEMHWKLNGGFKEIVERRSETIKSYYRSEDIILLQSTDDKNWFICNKNLVITGNKFEGDIIQ